MREDWDDIRSDRGNGKTVRMVATASPEGHSARTSSRMRWATEDRDTPWYLRAMPTWAPEPVDPDAWGRCSQCRGVFPGRYRELLRVRVAKDGQPVAVCPECDERQGCDP